VEKGDVKIVMKREKKVVEVPVAAGVPVTAAGGSAAVFEGQGGPAATGGPVVAGPGAAASCGAPGEPTPDNVVTCPLVGTFYSSPSPDAEDFVKVGDHVKKGQVIGIVEAMKLMNEIESEYDGIVEAILVKNEETVEYGQPLFRIR